MKQLTVRSRLLVIGTAALLSAATIVVAGPLLAQDDSSSTTPPASTMPAAEEGATAAREQLELGQIFISSTFHLVATDVFLAPSPDVPGYTDVRVALSLRNTSAESFPYRVDGFVGGGGYPALSLVDGDGTAYPYQLDNFAQVAMPGSSVATVDPGMTARWTVGFRVPTAASRRLGLVADSVDGAAVWDLASTGSAPAWELPTAESVSLGTEVDWDGGLKVRPVDHASLVCGDPDSQLVTYLFALVVELRNDAMTDAAWPGIRAPQVPALAVWADGASAQLRTETFVGAENLNRVASDEVRVPPKAGVYNRALLFAVPRDGRVSDAQAAPRAVFLNRPEGTPLVVQVAGPDGLAIDPAYCDTGALPGPIPFAFSPGALFDVGNSAPPLDIAAADLAAQQLLSEAWIIASKYAEAADGYPGLSASKLAAIWDGVNYADGFANGGKNIVGVHLVTNPETVVFSTQSESGTWFCLSASTGGGPANQISDPELDVLEAACVPVEIPPASEEEAPAP